MFHYFIILIRLMDIYLFSILTSELLLKYAEIRMELLLHSLLFIIHVE